MIEVEHLVKQYGTVRAVNDVSFTAKPNEIVGLLGPNGAGKTTTMRVITGYMPPTSGVIKVAGFDVLEDSLSVRQQVGYMPERVPIYPDMTVRDYVTFWAKLRRVPQPKTAVDNVLERFSLTDRSRSLVGSLSKGLRQRLGLAQAVVHQPAVVILDEPTIGIDPKQVIEVRDYVKSLRDGHTVLFSSHILSEVEHICDRVVILNKGRVVASGTTELLSQRLRPGLHLFIRVKAAEADTRRALEAVQGITAIHAQDKGWLISSETDIRDEVTAALLANRLKLLELRPVEVSLEDIFLDVVG